ncbi:IS21 family transposase [Streptomyces sp. NPDC018031]|uniref:IS21 family transposase n=1 Tax=Streptomyces sp. NPDC018031 TaxID=3365033 RepID=UPI0037BCBD3B
MKKSDKEIIEILVAYDATECAHSAARVAGCDPKTVRRYVAARDAGRPVTGPSRREREIDGHMEKIEEWVERSEGHLSAARAHQRLLAMGYTGSERTTRRAVAEAKARRRAGHPRTYRPWIAEPGLWLQFDWADGPLLPAPDGTRRRTALFCAWLAWSRFRVVIPCRDRTLPTLVCCLDTTLRRLGGAPTHLLTRPRRDVGIRHPDLVRAAGHYGVQVRVCAPYDPRRPGGGRPGEVRLAPADLVPTGTELRREYGSLDELRDACRAFGDTVNGGPWRGRCATGAPGRPAPAAPGGGTPYDRLTVERQRLHPLPDAPRTAELGRPAIVGDDHTVTFDGLRYPVLSVPRGGTVWLRAARGELAVVADLDGLTEAARFRIGRRGFPGTSPGR